MTLTPHSQRICTAAVAVGFVGLALWLGGVLVTLTLLLLCALGLWEFTAMFRPGPEHKGLRVLAVILGSALVLAARLGGPQAAQWALAACFWALALRFLLRYGKVLDAADFADEIIVLCGLAYIPLMLQLVLLLNTREIVLVILSTAASDTAAYYSGTLWGKAKVWPQVSPKKSWAGSVGGMAGCVAAVAAFGLALGEAPLAAWLALGVVLNLAAQFGDFFESALKRRLGVKDSGTLLPGHGGLLDRIDSLLLALPCYALFRQLIPLFP